jgi:PIN domain nuclease of toxin-antitoxin system
MSEYLLDTCALIWLSRGEALRNSAQDKIGDSVVRVSLVSVWELGNLTRKGRISLAMPVAAWFHGALASMDADAAELSAEVLAASCDLPGSPPEDPADRIIIATAREQKLTIVTRDRKILHYAESGHARALAC